MADDQRSQRAQALSDHHGRLDHRVQPDRCVVHEARAAATSFIETSDVVISRNGRIIPTTPWESVWYAVAEWFGVSTPSMAEVLPNLGNFPLHSMFRASATDGRPGLTV